MEPAATTRLTFRPLPGGVGVEATGVDLSGDVDEETRRVLYRALVDHAALVVKDQRFDPRRFLAAGSLFGTPFRKAYSKAVEGEPRVQLVSSHERRYNGAPMLFGNVWHTDHINVDRPPKFTVLYAVELFREGGSTGIVDMRAAYEDLPERTKARVDGRQVVYEYREPDASYLRSAPESSAAMDARTITRPLVRTNPDTGRKALYVHPGIAKGIVGLAQDETRALLHEVVTHALAPRYAYHHRWSLGDLLLWDNRQTMHRADFDYDPADTSQHRLLYRMMIEGERPQ